MTATADRRRRARAALVLAAALAAGISAGRRVDEGLRIRADAPREGDPTVAAADVGAVATAALPLRLVDAGGVGIAPDAAAWGGGDYSHNTRAFHDLMLRDPPYVDESRFAQVRRDWACHLDRMAAYGNNGVVIGVFLELVDFDGVGGGEAVYPAASPYRHRHRVLRDRFGELFRMARGRGFQVFLKTDMLTLTEPLARYLRGRPGGLDARRPELWRAYAAGLQELFARLPEVDGVVVRVGEAGPLFNEPGWPYWSAFEVSDRAALRTMLRELLPAFERAGKLLVLRTWTVGPGPLGDLHTNPEAYERALGDIDSPSLVVSTKYVAGDFFGFLPLNATLAHGRHRRIVELQARREFEGFGAFPNYVAPAHQHALRVLRARNPNIVGTWLWTQDGGPVRAGPLSLYPLHGFWEWIDANVYATSRLAADPAADVGAVTREWVAREIAADPEVVDAVSRILLRSREAIEQGFYVRPFAEQRLRMGAVEVPPLLWIMEWDVVGGWSSVLSTVYHWAGADLAAVRAEGFRAVGTVREARLLLEKVRPRLPPSAPYLPMHRSLLYEESLLTTLAWYRSAFLDYYRWLDVADAGAYDAWRRGRESYGAARREHEARYARDLDFPAFDFDAADAALVLAARDRPIAGLARAWLALLALVLALGSPAAQRATRAFAGKTLARSLWTSVVSPGTAVAPRGLGAVWAAAAFLAASCAIASAALFSFASWRPPILATALLAAGGGGLTLGWWSATRRHPARTAAVALAPVHLLAALVLGALSLRGPLHFWFLFWTSSAFRVAFVALAITLLAWTLLASFDAGRRLTGRRTAALGAVLAGAGAALLAAGALLPETQVLLGLLHSPLALLPLTFAVVLGIVTYLGVPPVLAPYPAVAGLVLMAGGTLLTREGRSRRERDPSHPAP